MSIVDISPHVLIIDDDKTLLDAVGQSFELADIDVKTENDPEAALSAISDQYPGVIVTDVRMPKLDGISLFRKVAEIDSELPVILMSGHGDAPMVLSTLREGVFDFFMKPIDMEIMQASVRRALEARKLVLENRQLRNLAEVYAGDTKLIGDTPEIVQVRNMISEISGTDLDVLVTGEFGTGKEQVARTIHDLSERKNGPFVTVACGSIPEDLINGELYGYALGADPYSRKEKAGRIEDANRGTLHLSEIERLPLDVQGRLLKTIENGVTSRVGSDREIPISIRLVITTQIDLEELVKVRQFRDDLFHRIKPVAMTLPTLRQRRSDIPILFAKYLADAARLGRKKVPRLTKAMRSRLIDYDWPGNQRELKQYAEAIVSGVLRKNDSSASGTLSLPERVERFEANAIREALEQTKGDVRGSLELLQIPRKTFYDKVSRHRIDLKSYRKRN